MGAAVPCIFLFYKISESAWILRAVMRVEDYYLHENATYENDDGSNVDWDETIAWVSRRLNGYRAALRFSAYTLRSAATMALSTSAEAEASRLSRRVELVPAMSCCNWSGGVFGRRASSLLKASLTKTAPAIARPNVIPESWPMICSHASVHATYARPGIPLHVLTHNKRDTICHLLGCHDCLYDGEAGLSECAGAEAE